MSLTGIVWVGPGVPPEEGPVFRVGQLIPELRADSPPEVVRLHEMLANIPHRTWWQRHFEDPWNKLWRGSILVTGFPTPVIGTYELTAVDVLSLTLFVVSTYYAYRGAHWLGKAVYDVGDYAGTVWTIEALVDDTTTPYRKLLEYLLK